MRLFTLVIRSLTHYRRTHLGVLLGVAVTTTVLVGALLVGDSVKHTLLRFAHLRLGSAHSAVIGGERFFQADLAERFTRSSGVPSASLVFLRGVAAASDGRARTNRAQILGVDRRFWQLAPQPPPDLGIAPGQAAVNTRLARKLKISVGDELILRVEDVDLLPSDTPLAPSRRDSRGLRVKVADVVDENHFGRFSLSPSQVPPFSVFVPLDWLAEKLDLQGRANLLLISGREGLDSSCREMLNSVWTLADAGLAIRTLTGGAVCELRSDRVFVEDRIAELALRLQDESEGVFTYFVNEIRHGDVSTPYSFVCGRDRTGKYPDLADDEILVSRWLADDLALGEGDTVALTYSFPVGLRRLEERTARFRVRGVLPGTSPLLDPGLMPDFPGLADSESCDEWTPGVSIDLGKIRDKDKAYWQDRRGTPKAVVSLPAAQQMWSNRFGTLTSVRFSVENSSAEEVVDALLRDLTAELAGFRLLDVRGEGIRAGKESVDFAQLFIGLSFFILVSSLLLTGLLFVLGMEQRSSEQGVLLSIGFPSRRVRWLLIIEGGVVAAAGVLVGMAGGAGYNRGVLRGLETVWKGAVGTSTFVTDLSMGSLAGGAGLSLGVAVAAMWLATFFQSRRSIREFHGGTDAPRGKMTRTGRICLKLGAVAFIIAVAVLLAAEPGRGKAASGIFFSVGGLLLFGSLCLAYVLLLKIPASGRSGHRITLVRMGIRNCGRHPARGLAVIGSLACGVFLTVAVGANRHGHIPDPTRRGSGTGGFAFAGETTVPVYRSLNSDAGRRYLGLEKGEFTDLSWIHMTLREGDDASCLNLNRISRPRILGVKPEELARREAFTFSEFASDVDSDLSWNVLGLDLEDGVIPAVADRTVIVWGLGKTVGDSISVTDEHGKELKLRFVAGLANSVLQGNVLISDRAFREHFPSVGGSRVFLVDASPLRQDVLASKLTYALRDKGLELTPAPVKLAEFSTVENTYLTIFLALGGLGLVLGTAGMGIIVLRNVMERRQELALLRAIGFGRIDIWKLLLVEHAVLLGTGIFIGVVSAFAAVIPALLSPDAATPWKGLVILLAALLITGHAWIIVAAGAASRGRMVAALRNE